VTGQGVENMIGKLSEVEEKAIKELKDGLLKAYGSEVEVIRLFGSKARGDYSGDSDIDILVTVRSSDFSIWEGIQKIVASVSLKYNVFLSVKVMDLNHVSYLKHLDTALMRNIEKQGVDIWVKK
jgi:predicted nucleotidyltransferase